MIMCATVINSEPGRLLVCDTSKGQKVVVNTNNACRFQKGDKIIIEYSGIMALSMPPQISATCIRPQT